MMNAPTQSQGDSMETEVKRGQMPNRIGPDDHAWLGDDNALSATLIKALLKKGVLTMEDLTANIPITDPEHREEILRRIRSLAV
jgi:hypothetical protein